MTVVAGMIAVAPNRSMAVPTVNDLRVCMDTPASRRPKNIRVTSAVIAAGSRWAAAMNTAGIAVNIAAVNIVVVKSAVVARDTGAVAGKTNTTNAAVTAIPPAARALSVAT